MKSEEEAIEEDVQEYRKKVIKNWLYLILASVFLLLITVIMIYFNIGSVLLSVILIVIQIIIVVIAVVNIIMIQKFLTRGVKG